MKLSDHDIIILDGACGTNIQKMNLPADAWGQYEGCNEYLNISCPEAIVELHRSFVEAGAMVLETNTFGANLVVLEEYGLADKVEHLNHAAVANARKAIAGKAGTYIAGSIGPGTKLPSLGHITADKLADSYAVQIRSLLEAGVDWLIIETCQDMLQVKVAIVTAFEQLEALGKNIPVSVSVTMENAGTMLMGADLDTVITTLEPFDIFSLGLNCSTGPAGMASYVKHLSQYWPKRIALVPNAGIPEVIDGKTVYRLGPADFAAQMKDFVTGRGVSVVGGCCGTTPEHIRQMAAALEGVKIRQRDVAKRAAVSSGYASVEIAQEIPPFVIGERTNANGSKKFRECLEAEDFDAGLSMAIDQQANGAHAIDLCTAYAGRDEKADLVKFTRMFTEAIKAPLVADSTNPACIEAALRNYPGRAIINSTNLEDGGEHLKKTCALAKKFGAAVVALTIDAEGMAMTADRKFQVAKKIYDLAVGEYGLRPCDLFFDTLTFTIGSGDKKLRTAAIETIEAIRRIKRELPGVFTVLGLSNISFGLTAKSRRVLNSVFLHEAIEAGLDAAIIDAGKITPLSKISAEDRQVCLDLIYDRTKAEGKGPLMAFIGHFENISESDKDESEAAGVSPQAQLFEKVLAGDRNDIADIIAALTERTAPPAIINEILIPAMRKVGDLFAKGEMLLPFVLQSAETVRAGVDELEKYMEKADAKKGLKVLLATVEGDVHDIGKNLVDIILSNNGYQVENIGIKVPTDRIIDKAKKLNADVIGLSGLLVKSAVIMQEMMPRLKAAGLDVPVLLGGAALTADFVANACAPNYGGPVVYCPDAFTGLKALREFEDGVLESTKSSSQEAQTKTPAGKPVELDFTHSIKIPEKLGPRYIEDITLDDVLAFMNRSALLRTRWGFKQGKLTDSQYKTLLEEKAFPLYGQTIEKCRSMSLFDGKIAYGFFDCCRQGDVLVVDSGLRRVDLKFDRQKIPPFTCISDYFKTLPQGGDIAGLFVVTVGSKFDTEIKRLFDAKEYHDYMIMHGLAVELAEAMAELIHSRIRNELVIKDETPRKYQGRRYAVGYSVWSDLSQQRQIFELLKPEKIGVTLTETFQMVPEQSTSAIVVHHPAARYFSV